MSDSPVLGCIADDFTGATDLGNTFVRQGIRTIQTIGVPATALGEPVAAVIVSLKTRTVPAADAVEQSLEALRWLREQGCSQYYFKYCSTFDSTDAGNIGPVTDALMRALGTPLTLACPAFPETGRTVFRGHLFVGDRLLSESGMELHPLTPMRDANLVRVLQRQSSARVGLLRYADVTRGYDACRDALQALHAAGDSIAVADAISDGDLDVLGQVAIDLRLATGGSGLGRGVARALCDARTIETTARADVESPAGERAVILAGSCSQATLAQIDRWRSDRPAFYVDPFKLAAGADGMAQVVDAALTFAHETHAGEPVLIYAGTAPTQVQAVQAALGAAAAGALVESALAEIARALHARGVRRFVIAGGETSGAVVQALNVTALRIGEQIDPGVPWTMTPGPDPIALALKSGNFGSLDFFSKALAFHETAAHA